MKFAAVAAIAIAFATTAQAAYVDVQAERVIPRPGTIKMIIKVTNNFPDKVSNVVVACTFLDRERRAVDIGYARIGDMEAHAHAYDSVSITADDGIVKYAECHPYGAH